MPYKIIRFENIGKYFKKNKAFDATLKDLRDQAKSKQALQTKKYKENGNWGIRFEGINKYGDLEFSTNSQEKTGRYTQFVRFYGIKDMKPKNMKEVLDIVREADVGVSCNDPSFLYWGAAYNATKNGYNIFVESREPKEPNKNTKDNFVLCKHLIAVLHAVPFYWPDILKEYKKFFDLDKVKEEEIKEAQKEDFTEEEIAEAEDWALDKEKE